MFAPLNSEDEHTCLQANKELLTKINKRMKQKLLTLFVLLVTAMTAFADAKGSGVAYDVSKKSCVSFDYAFTETAGTGTVTFTITSVDASKVYLNSNDGNNVYIWDKTDGFFEKE